MKQLETTFKKNSFIHNIVWRDADYAITKLTDPDTGRFVCFEAFKIRKKPESKLGGRVLPASEITPSNEQWGKYGYTVYTLEQAHNKINILKNK